MCNNENLENMGAFITTFKHILYPLLLYGKDTSIEIDNGLSLPD